VIAFPQHEIASRSSYLFKPSALLLLLHSGGISLAWSRICALGEPLFFLEKRKGPRVQKKNNLEGNSKSAHDSGSNPECPITNPFSFRKRKGLGFTPKEKPGAQKKKSLNMKGAVV